MFLPIIDLIVSLVVLYYMVVVVYFLRKVLKKMDSVLQMVESQVIKTDEGDGSEIFDYYPEPLGQQEFDDMPES